MLTLLLSIEHARQLWLYKEGLLSTRTNLLVDNSPSFWYFYPSQHQKLVLREIQGDFENEYAATHKE